MYEFVGQNYLVIKLIANKNIEEKFDFLNGIQCCKYQLGIIFERSK
jgi:hypothetical protein